MLKNQEKIEEVLEKEVLETLEQQEAPDSPSASEKEDLDEEYQDSEQTFQN